MESFEDEKKSKFKKICCTTRNMCKESMEKRNLDVPGVIKKICVSLYKRSEGVVWGFAEGISSGALTGLCVTGAGGWICGLVGQIFGAICGPIGGCFSGMILGALSDKETMKQVFAHYRENFGVNNSRRIAQRSNVQ